MNTESATSVTPWTIPANHRTMGLPSGLDASSSHSGLQRGRIGCR